MPRGNRHRLAGYAWHIEQAQEELGGRARYRRMHDAPGASILREPEEAYGAI